MGHAMNSNSKSGGAATKLLDSRKHSNKGPRSSVGGTVDRASNFDRMYKHKNESGRNTERMKGPATRVEYKSPYNQPLVEMFSNR